MKRITSATVLFVSLIAVTLFSEGCYYDNAKALYPMDTIYVNDSLIDSTTTYVYADIESIISSNCATSGCHAAGNGAGRQPLSTYNEVKSAIESFTLKNRVESGTMPKGFSLSNTDKTALINWINQGYPEN